MDINYLSNMTTLELNISGQLTQENLIPAAIESTNTLSEGYFGLSVMFAIFIFFIVISFKQDGDMRLDIIRSILFGSGFAFITGLMLLVSGLTTNLIHVLWFLVIFVITFMMMLGIKKRGQ